MQRYANDTKWVNKACEAMEHQERLMQSLQGAGYRHKKDSHPQHDQGGTETRNLVGKTGDTVGEECEAQKYLGR